MKNFINANSFEFNMPPMPYQTQKGRFLFTVLFLLSFLSIGCTSSLNTETDYGTELNSLLLTTDEAVTIYFIFDNTDYIITVDAIWTGKISTVTMTINNVKYGDLEIGDRRILSNGDELEILSITEGDPIIEKEASVVYELRTRK